MTKDEYKTLSARAYADKDFREDFAKTPREAAQRLGIALTDDEVRQLQAAADRIRAFGTEADKRMWSGDKAYIPLTPLKPPK